MTYQIGVQTQLTDKQWITGFLATLDENDDSTHQSYEFFRDNRYEDDGMSDELEVYQELCKELDIHF